MTRLICWLLKSYIIASTLPRNNCLLLEQVQYYWRKDADEQIEWRLWIVTTIHHPYNAYCRQVYSRRSLSKWSKPNWSSVFFNINHHQIIKFCCLTNFPFSPKSKKVLRPLETLCLFIRTTYLTYLGTLIESVRSTHDEKLPFTIQSTLFIPRASPNMRNV